MKNYILVISLFLVLFISGCQPQRGNPTVTTSTIQNTAQSTIQSTTSRSSSAFSTSILSTTTVLGTVTSTTSILSTTLVPGVSCTLPDGSKLSSGLSKNLYDIPMSDNCQAHLQVKTCINGQLSGNQEYYFQSCGISQVSRSYKTSYESLEDFAGFYIVPQNYLSTSSHDFSSVQVHSGVLAEKAWMYGANNIVSGQNTNHRAYPAIQLSKTSGGYYKNLVVTEIYVWLDVPLYSQAEKDWFSFATFTSYDDNYWFRSELFNIGVEGTKENYGYLMHVPDQGSKVIDIFQTSSITFPRKKWVKLTFLIDYTNNNMYSSPFIKVWQDDKIVSAARFNPRLDINSIPKSQWPSCMDGWTGGTTADAEQRCGLVYTGGLAQAHFGLYAPPLLSTGTVYNDDLSVYEIKV